MLINFCGGTLIVFSKSVDSKMSKNKTSVPVRRSTRQSGKALSVEPTPRGPLKRTKRPSDDQPSAAVKGIIHEENGWDDEETPSKKLRLDSGDTINDRASENEMDVDETAKENEKNEDQEMDTEEDLSNESSLPKICKDTLKDVNLSPRVVLGQRCRAGHSLNEDIKRTKPKQGDLKQPATPTKFTPQIKPQKKTEKIHDASISSMDEYRMEAKARIADIPKDNHFVPSVRPLLEKKYTMRQHVSNIPAQKETVLLKKQEVSKKTSGTKSRSGNSCRGFVWYLWRLIFLLLLSSATLLAYRIFPVLQRTTDKEGYQSREAKPGIFSVRLSLLKTQFPSQRPELWSRSQIHLERHLKTAHPTEPVSLIFAAGLGAKRTLDCLARSLASAYSSALHASVLNLDGASKSGQGSDEVKLDIDNQLRAAFEGNEPVAVIHRFEELPPGSTLIFYRYCDHENAAYKQVFLLFTVLLPQEKMEGEPSLKEVEELVLDYVQEKQVGSTSNSGYNEMDIDKFSGLWSRISHLILPVVPEEHIEQDGCP